jgi:hypothetical protein
MKPDYESSGEDIAADLLALSVLLVIFGIVIF